MLAAVRPRAGVTSWMGEWGKRGTRGEVLGLGHGARDKGLDEADDGGVAGGRRGRLQRARQRRVGRRVQRAAACLAQCRNLHDAEVPP